MYTKKEREEYNIYRRIVCEKLGITKNEYNKFRRLANQLHRCYEKFCNGEYPTDAEYEADIRPLEEKIIKLAKEKGLNVYFQTDPRGAALFLSKESVGPDNYPVVGSAII